MLANSESDLCFEPIRRENLSEFRFQNSLLFPITYPESFYRHILTFRNVFGFLVYCEGSCIGSCSFRIEPESRWEDIVAGRTLDNFTPVDDSFLTNSASKVCYIMTLGVLAIHRSSGLGSSILREITKRSRDSGIERIGLHVHSGNQSALRFYQQRSFKILGTVENYYKKIVPNSAHILEYQNKEKEVTES